MKKILLSVLILIGFNSAFAQCPTSVVALSSSKIQFTFSSACSSGDPIGYVALYVSGYSGYRGYLSSKLSNTSTTTVTIDDLDDYSQNFTGNTTAWTSSNTATRIRTEDISFNSCNDCTNNFALPVNLTNFFGKSQQNITRLFWETAQEINNKKFEIERSLNSTDFEKIGEVKGVGNSNEITKYTFEDIDIQTLPEKVYYRLKQIDFDGKSEYSIIVLVRKNHNTLKDVRVKYNSDKQAIRVLLNNPELNTHHIEILDLQGKKLIQSHTSKNYLDLGTATLPKGMYLVKIFTSENSGYIYRKVITQ